MSKEFYTEKDIEDLVQRGIPSLQVTENVVLTELAYEKAHRLGLQLISDRVDNLPGAPVRPYLSEAAPRSQPAVVPAARTMPQSAPTPVLSQGERGNGDVENRIRSAVIAKLGNQVDAQLLDN